jgi:hypothetical protein
VMLRVLRVALAVALHDLVLALQIQERHLGVGLRAWPSGSQAGRGREVGVSGRARAFA